MVMNKLLYIFAISETLFLCIYLFSTGFLLSKDVIETSSTCKDFHNSSSMCWTTKTYNKLIFIIIDGLRYDMATYNESLKLEDKEYYKNNIKIFHELQKQFPQNARLSRFIADAPTTTSQRIKGLTTGSLPTFIEAGSSFGSEDIGNEDNIIDQLKKANRNIVALGDDTWMKLFPGRYHRSHFFPSFNMMDLHTVDDGILAALYGEIEKTDWDMLIAHFLGVDHCGHVFGARTNEMELKLAQMDGVLRNVIDLMDEETILLVAGDHGMTLNGDHGGESSDEVTSALFAYSRKPIFARATPTKFSERPHTVDQIDLVPTMALLMGVPIPYSNIGTVIADMFAADELAPLVVNAKQIYRYLDAYRSGNSHFSHWPIIRDAYQSLMDAPTRENGDVFFNLAKKTCRNSWCQFDITVMTVSLVSALILLLVYSIRAANILRVMVAVNVILALYFLVSYAFLWLLPVFLCCYVVSIGCDLGLPDVGTVVSLMWFILASLSTLSNSYVIDEHLVGHFLIASLASVILYRCIQRSKRVPGWVDESPLVLTCIGSCYGALLTAVRLGVVSFRCREEQKWCTFKTPFFHKSLAVLGVAMAWARVVIAIAIICCPVALVVLFRPKNNIGVILTVANLLFVSFYWLAMLYGSLINSLAILSYFITIFLYINSICNRYWTRFKDNIFYLPIKREYSLQNKSCDSSQISHSNSKCDDFINRLFSSYAILLTNIFITIVLILSSGYAISAFLLVLSGVCVLFLHSCLVWKQGSSRDLFRIQMLPVLLWFFLCQQGFYVTGHQMTFSTIHWTAAFVGFPEANNLAAGILVGIDTFASHILYGITSPLLFLTPFIAGKFLQMGRTEVSSSYLYNNGEKMLTGITQNCASYIMIHAVKVLLTSLAALILRRHLMLWAIFAPHFIFEAIGFGVTCASVLLSYIFFASYWQIVKYSQK